MKVVWNSTDGTPVTFHPVLGRLKNGEPFELDASVAGPYIQSGLLVKHKESRLPARIEVDNPPPAQSKKKRSRKNR